VRADDLRAFGFVVDEVVDLRYGAIEDRNLLSVVVHVEDEILSHDCQSDQSDVTTCLFHESSLTFQIPNLCPAWDCSILCRSSISPIRFSYRDQLWAFGCS